MSESSKEWKIQGSRVYGKGHSYNCHNRVTAEQLYNTLTQYEKDYQTYRGITKQYDNITKQIIQLQLSVKILEHEINTLQEVVAKCKSQ